SLLWPGRNRPQQINYTQGWAQWAIVLPMLVTGYLVGAILWEQTNIGGLSEAQTFGDLFVQAVKYWPFPLAVIFASLWLLSVCSIRGWKDWKGVVAAALAPFPALLLLHTLLCAIMRLLHEWKGDTSAGAWHAFVWAPALVLYVLSLTVVMLIGMMGRQSKDDVREWWSRLGAWLGIYAFAWMLIAIVAVYGPCLVAMLIESHPWTVLGASGGWIGSTVAGLLAGR